MVDPRPSHSPLRPSNAPPQGMHREDIKSMIRKRGSTLRRISINAGLEKATVSICLRRPSPKANRAVAAFLGLPLHVLWPQWYDALGRRIRRSRASPARDCRATLNGSHEKCSTNCSAEQETSHAR